MSRIVGWLRAGYPHGVPDQDYLPMLALLRRRLTDEEVKQVGKALRRARVIPADKIDIGVGITNVTDELPSETDMRRVAARLQKKGWPVEEWESSTQ